MRDEDKPYVCSEDKEAVAKPEDPFCCAEILNKRCKCGHRWGAHGDYYCSIAGCECERYDEKPAGMVTATGRMSTTKPEIQRLPLRQSVMSDAMKQAIAKLRESNPRPHAALGALIHDEIEIEFRAGTDFSEIDYADLERRVLESVGVDIGLLKERKEFSTVSASMEVLYGGRKWDDKEDP